MGKLTAAILALAASGLLVAFTSAPIQPARSGAGPEMSNQLSLIYSTDLLDDPAYGDLDDAYDLPLMLSGAIEIPTAAILLDKGWLDPLPGSDLRPRAVNDAGLLHDLQRAYGVRVDVIHGTRIPFDPNGGPPPSAWQLRDVIVDNSPVVVVATGTLRDIAWVLQAYPELESSIAAVWIFAGDADLDSRSAWLSEVGRADWNAAADPAALAAVIWSGIDVYWFPVFDGGVWTNQEDASWYQVAQGALFERAPAPVRELLMERWEARQEAVDTDPGALPRRFEDEIKSMWVSGLLLRIDPTTGAFVPMPGVATTTPVSVTIDSKGFFVEGGYAVNRLDVLDPTSYGEAIAKLHAQGLEPVAAGTAP